MTHEEKQLLLKDICARLPYFENWVQYEGKDYIVTGYGHGRVSLLSSPFLSASGPCPLVEDIKPYLRPMYSMTEEETEKWLDAIHYYDKAGNPCPTHIDSYDWLNAHHFDYRGLIPMRLALEAPEGMYKTE